MPVIPRAGQRERGRRVTHACGLVHLARMAGARAARVGPKGIRVNAVAPGPVSTEGTEGMREAQGYLASLAPARRLGTPEEIAAAIVYLASPQAAFTHGVVLPVDGGRVAV
jgi:NAD(P)-dependent dehydrogenase (short-subunit alcohol dehydrogenase family)